MLNEQVNDQSHDQKIITKWTLLEHTGEGTASTPPHNLDRRFFSTIGENQATEEIMVEDNVEIKDTGDR